MGRGRPRFCEVVLRARLKKGYTQAYVGQMLTDNQGKARTHAYLSEVERGWVPHKDEIIDRLAIILEIDRYELFYLAGKLPPELRGCTSSKTIRSAMRNLAEQIQPAEAEAMA